MERAVPGSVIDGAQSDVLDPAEVSRRWLGELYVANATSVFNVCRRLLKSQDDAADATHEVFLRAISSLRDRPTGSVARAWLLTVARNHCLDLLRRQKRFGTALAVLAADVRLETDQEVAVTNRQLLQAVLQRLGSREREALRQFALEDRPPAEIARRLGLSYMATAQLLHRARRHAGLVAARLAAILGLVQLNNMRRRQDLADVAKSLTTVAVVPVLLAALVTSSSFQPGQTGRGGGTNRSDVASVSKTLAAVRSRSPGGGKGADFVFSATDLSSLPASAPASVVVPATAQRSGSVLSATCSSRVDVPDLQKGPTGTEKSGRGDRGKAQGLLSKLGQCAHVRKGSGP